MTVWIASFDIGKKNFSFYIEECDKQELLEIPNITKNNRYCTNSTPTPGFDALLHKVYKNGRKILLENVDLTHDTNKDLYLDSLIFHNMTKLLDYYIEYWDQCDIFIIEKQMSFRGKINTMALKLGQHCWSYFALKYGRSKEIIEFPAYHKTQILGAAKDEKCTKTGKISYQAINKACRKKWCITKALSILTIKNDLDTITYIKSKRKQDDLADVICQLQAFKYCFFIDKCI